MTELLTAAQMRAIEAAAIASGEVTGLELMERAGRGVVEAIFEEWPDLKATSHRAVVLCGPGNNGGDGFVVARLLKEWGWEVEVFLYGDPEKLPPDARVNYERWLGMGEVRDASEIEDEDQLIESNAQVFVDALFGTGLNKPIEFPSQLLGPFFDFSCRWQFDAEPARTVSVDVPSGMCSDSGRTLGGVLWAALTVTFHAPKVGHFLEDKEKRGMFGGAVACGELRVHDIGLPKQHRLNLVHQTRSQLPKDQQQTVWTTNGSSRPLGKAFSREHKYSHGHALILSGGAGKGGAARLAARGALRIGAGLVTVGCPPEALAENAARLDAVMLRPVADADAFGRVLEDKRINALCLGPGLGTGEREVALVAAALGGKRPLVLDADALTILAREPDLFAALHPNCVLTPHAGEFARLFPDIAEKLSAPATKGPAYSKVDATREAAARAGCVVLYKGPDTVIADPSGRCSINSAHYDRAAPWLATAGSGDVLAGFIAGLLARGFGPMQAAETAAWLHVECALFFGPGLIAEDLPEELPKVFRALGV
ncbi:MAG: NAD(P)H-hydrate dehydratase [Rhodobacteraceae bacterium]|nr:NAD(P)H-hydrate dehydratase [Paracoccaceae bacterium]